MEKLSQQTLVDIEDLIRRNFNRNLQSYLAEITDIDATDIGEDWNWIADFNEWSQSNGK